MASQSYENPNSGPLPAPLALSEATLADIISALARIADEDALEQVVESLDTSRDIPPSLQAPLKELEAKSNQSLIALFVAHHFTAISEGTLQSLLRRRTHHQLMELWESVMDYKSDPFAQRVLCLILQQRGVFSSLDPKDNKILGWLNGATWDDIDKNIVDNAIEGSSDIYYALARAVERDKINRVPIVSPSDIAT